MSVDVWIAVAAFGMSIVALFLPRYWQNNDEQVQELGKKIDALETKLEAAVDRRIEEKFRGVEKDITSINQRLSDGDESFEAVKERNQKIEMAVAAKVADLKDWMRETFVSKADLKTFLAALRNSNQN